MSLLGSFLGLVGEQFWPTYERIKNYSVFELEEGLNTAENKTIKAVFLLALSKNDNFLAKQIYLGDRDFFDNRFRALSNYYKFKRIIEVFYRKIRY